MAQISLCGKLSCEMELKISADKYFEHFISPYLTATSCPKVFDKVDLLEGQWGKQGCVTFWNFRLADGKRGTAKSILELIDHKNKKIEYNVIGGNLLEGFKTFKFILDITPKSSSCSVRWTLEFEKMNGSTPEPTAIIDLINYMNPCIEAYFNQA